MRSRAESAIATTAGGLAILGRDRPWARRLHGRILERVGRIVRGLRAGVKSP